MEIYFITTSYSAQIYCIITSYMKYGWVWWRIVDTDVDGGTSIDINLNRKRQKIELKIAEFENKTQTIA